VVNPQENRALSVNKVDSVEALIATGLRRQETGDWTGAADCFRQAARLDPPRAVCSLLLGDAMGRLNDWGQAVESYQNAIRIDPAFADAYNNLGIALVEMGRDSDAIAAYARAIEIDARHANAYFNLGKLSARLNEVETASGLFATAISLQPMHAYAYHELGSLQEKSGWLEMATASYARSIELDPTRTVRENLAAVLTLLGDARGIAQMEELVREQPLNAESHWNLGMGLLLHGRYAEGWREFEWRTQIPRFHQYHHRFDQPGWRGGSLEGETILLYGEQGHGDTLQFLRYVPLVAERGGRVLLEVHPVLRGLLEGFPGVAEWVEPGGARPEFSTYASLMSLPHLLRSAEIPAPVALGIRDMGSGERLPSGVKSGELKVGLAWAGNPGHKRDHLRSIPLVQWRPLAKIEGVAFTSLQVVPASLEAGNAGRYFDFVEDCTGLPDFEALAAVVSKLDLVITVDTAVAHLAGSMGKPVWILLPQVVDWRWGLEGTSTEWYPTARLFRQTTPGDWSGVIADVGKELQKLVRTL